MGPLFTVHCVTLCQEMVQDRYLCCKQGGMGCLSVGRVSDQHTTDTGLIPQYGKRFFFPGSTFSADSVMVHPCVQSHALTSCSPYQSLVDFRNTKTPSIHRTLGIVTLFQLTFPRIKQPKFSLGEIPVGQYSCLSQWDHTFFIAKVHKTLKSGT